MKIEDKSALLVIDIQQEDFVGMKENDNYSRYSPDCRRKKFWI